MSTKIPRLNLLVSAAYMEEREMQAIRRIGKSAHWLIDSGAFTNHQAQLRGERAPVPLSSFMHWCHELEPYVWEVIALDVVMDVEATRSNLEAMHQDGLTPMPVFVHGEEWERLPGLVAAHPQGRLCVAGGVKTRKDYAHHRYQKAWRVSEGKAQIHALGFVRWPDIFQLPLFTVDSSSWMAGGRMGVCGHYTRTVGMRTVAWKDLGSKRGLSVRGHLSRCGISVDQMRDESLTKGVGGFLALSVINAYVELHCHASMLRPAYFFVIPNVGWLLALVAVVVAKRGRGDGTFDYHQASSLLTAYRERMKGGEDKRDEALDHLRAVLDEHTAATAEPYSQATRPLHPAKENAT